MRDRHRDDLATYSSNSILNSLFIVQSYFNGSYVDNLDIWIRVELQFGIHISHSQPVEDSSDDIVPALLNRPDFTVFRGSVDHPLPLGEEIIR